MNRVVSIFGNFFSKYVRKYRQQKNGCRGKEFFHQLNLQRLNECALNPLKICQV